MAEATTEEIAEAMYEMIKDGMGKKKYKATDLQKAMVERFHQPRNLLFFGDRGDRLKGVTGSPRPRGLRRRTVLDLSKEPHGFHPPIDRRALRPLNGQARTLLQAVPHPEHKQQQRVGVNERNVAKVKLVHVLSDEYIEHLIDRLHGELRHGRTLLTYVLRSFKLAFNVTPQPRLLLKERVGLIFEEVIRATKVA